MSRWWPGVDPRECTGAAAPFFDSCLTQILNQLPGRDSSISIQEAVSEAIDFMAIGRGRKKYWGRGAECMHTLSSSPTKQVNLWGKGREGGRAGGQGNWGLCSEGESGAQAGAGVGVRLRTHVPPYLFMGWRQLLLCFAPHCHMHPAVGWAESVVQPSSGRHMVSHWGSCSGTQRAAAVASTPHTDQGHMPPRPLLGCAQGQEPPCAPG